METPKLKLLTTQELKHTSLVLIVFSIKNVGDFLNGKSPSEFVFAFIFTRRIFLRNDDLQFVFYINLMLKKIKGGALVLTKR
jgi:hypothetical protein